MNRMSYSTYHFRKKNVCQCLHCIVTHENYNDGYSCPIDLVPPHSIHWYFCGNFPKGLFDHATAYAQCISSAYSIQSKQLMFNTENENAIQQHANYQVIFMRKAYFLFSTATVFFNYSCTRITKLSKLQGLTFISFDCLQTIH